MYSGQQCEGFGPDLLVDFEGTAAECMAKCIELGDNCVGFVRVNYGIHLWESEEAGKCYFRSTALQQPYEYLEDFRDCFIRNEHFRAYEGQQCWWGSPLYDDNYLLKDFEGTAAECQAKCIELGEDCTSFVRVNDGSNYAGKCYFRSRVVRVEDPYDYDGDDRDCFVREGFTDDMSELEQFTIYDGQECWNETAELYTDYEGTAAACMDLCIQLDCAGFTRVNDDSGLCYIYSSGLEEPSVYADDDRDCFARYDVGEYVYSAAPSVWAVEFNVTNMLIAGLVIANVVNMVILAAVCCGNGSSNKHRYGAVVIGVESDSEQNDD